MSTWTLANPHMLNSNAVYDLVKDGEVIAKNWNYDKCYAFIYDKAEAADWVTEEDNPWQGDTVRNVWLNHYLMELFFKEHITIEQHNTLHDAGPDAIAKQFGIDFE